MSKDETIPLPSDTDEARDDGLFLAKLIVDGMVRKGSSAEDLLRLAQLTQNPRFMERLSEICLQKAEEARKAQH